MQLTSVIFRAPESPSVFSSKQRWLVQTVGSQEAASVRRVDPHSCLPLKPNYSSHLWIGVITAAFLQTFGLVVNRLLSLFQLFPCVQIWEFSVTVDSTKQEVQRAVGDVFWRG